MRPGMALWLLSVRRQNFGNPISNLVLPASGRTTHASGARVVQFALRYDF